MKYSIVVEFVRGKSTVCDVGVLTPKYRQGRCFWCVLRAYNDDMECVDVCSSPRNIHRFFANNSGRNIKFVDYRGGIYSGGEYPAYLE